MGCGSSSETVMENVSKKNREIAKEQLNILTSSLLAALYTHHAATKWFEIVKKRTERLKFERRLLFENYGDSDDEDSKVPLVRITSCSEYSRSSEKEIEMQKTPAEQLELFTGSLMSALYTIHAATKWYHKWKRAPIKRANKNWQINDSEDIPNITGSSKKSAKEQLDIFTGSLLSALCTYHAAKKWYYISKKSPMMRLTRSKNVNFETDFGDYPHSGVSKKSAAENLDVVTESLLSALYTYHAAMKWQQTSSSASKSVNNEASSKKEKSQLPLPPPPASGAESSSSVADVKERAKEQLDVVTGSLLSALYTYHSASTWYDEWQNSPAKDPSFEKPSHPSHETIPFNETEKDDKPTTESLRIESDMKKTAKEQLDLVAGSLLSALYTYHASTEWHEIVQRGSSKEPNEVGGDQHSPKGDVQFPAEENDETLSDIFENKKKQDDVEIVTVTLLTTLLTYRAANKWHNRICKATVELLQELGFGEDEGIEGVPEENNQGHPFETGGQTKTTAEELDIAIAHLLSDLNSKLEKTTRKNVEEERKSDGNGVEVEEGEAKADGNEVTAFGTFEKTCCEGVNEDELDPDSEDEILTMVTEFVDGDEGGAKFFESTTTSVARLRRSDASEVFE